MKFRTMLAATAALSLAATPAIAEAAFDRAAAPVEGESELGAGGSGTIIAIVAAAAIIAGIIIAADGDDDDPVSA
ncbi:hypothetical protein P7228_02880 [Altererythrobacter arenosus]|uniref:Uncharacterized protein n=1 Tax=Altererythrobacter arenosus TaxID=3032592 RepID=A0ABY8FSP4_9SPHN|nr:hypothetical protein [Altererythrobacter sp. CAU 1644]WFL78029.1 hypothetical protein P7228_02880 [Altererythrobacter sp. CAU 1644]